MEDRSWRTFILIGLTVLSVGITEQSHAAISEPDKKLFSEAMKATRNGDYYQASQKLRSLLKNRGDWGLAYLQLGILELDTNPNPEEAVSLLTRATHLLPTNPRAHYQLGVAKTAAGKFSEALKHIGKALELRPRYAQAHQQKAICHEHNGKPALAIESLETLLSLKKNHTAALSELARLYEQTGQPALSESKHQQLIDREPNLYFHWLNFAGFLRRQGREADAGKAFNRAEALRPRPQRKLRPLPRSSDLR